MCTVQRILQSVLFFEIFFSDILRYFKAFPQMFKVDFFVVCDCCRPLLLTFGNKTIMSLLGASDRSDQLSHWLAWEGGRK